MEVKACPLCGQPVELDNGERSAAQNGVWQILCLGCSLCLQRHYILDTYGKPAEKDSKKYALMDIVATWNKRV